LRPFPLHEILRELAPTRAQPPPGRRTAKQDFFVATLQQGAEEIARRTEPDPDLPPFEALAGSLDAFLGWIEENETAYRKLMESVGSVPEVKSLIDGIRDTTSSRILDGLAAGDPARPKLRAAARGWLWLMDGVILDWLEHRDLSRAEVRELLLASLAGSISAAGSPGPTARRRPRSPSSRSAPPP